jgi:hypothetical protein
VEIVELGEIVEIMEISGNKVDVRNRGIPSRDRVDMSIVF